MNQDEQKLRSSIREMIRFVKQKKTVSKSLIEENIVKFCLLYTSDAADE